MKKVLGSVASECDSSDFGDLEDLTNLGRDFVCVHYRGLNNYRSHFVGSYKEYSTIYPKTAF